jgi:hypothetical protein
MKSTKWMCASALGILILAGNFALAQGHGNGKGHEKHGDDDDQGEHFYKDHDREAMHEWHDHHQNNLSARTCQTRPVASWIGKATCAARQAPAGAPKTRSTLSGRP